MATSRSRTFQAVASTAAVALTLVGNSVSARAGSLTAPTAASLTATSNPPLPAACKAPLVGSVQPGSVRASAITVVTAPAGLLKTTDQGYSEVGSQRINDFNGVMLRQTPAETVVMPMRGATKNSNWVGAGVGISGDYRLAASGGTRLSDTPAYTTAVQKVTACADALSGLKAPKGVVRLVFGQHTP